jgi:RHS repeat-associated protein
VLLEKDYTWARTLAGSPYVGTLVSKLNPGASYAAQTSTVQVQDNYGNLTQSRVTDYANSTTGTRTYNFTYVYNEPEWGADYAAFYIFNRMTSAKATPAGGSAITLTSTAYDGACGAWGMTLSNATNNRDPAYGTTYGPTAWYRGNPATVSGLDSADTVCTAYDTAGVPYYSVDANGHSVSIQTNSDSSYSLPGVVTPGGNGNLATSASYASSWGVVSMTGPNGAQGTTTYDAYGRPSQTQIPDGAVTTYTYTYNPNTQTATVNGRWKTTTLDGFGRTTRVQTGNGGTIVSTVDTQYAPCACSPLGKMSKVSQPYGPSGTVYWTTYTYDGSGRTLTVTAPDGSSTTQYAYQGNSTTVTDPAGKWKTSTVDAYGNLVQVTEPNPAGGTFATSYTYTPANQITGVSMTRGNVTQTRTFLYNGSDLVTAANPENGTVTYTYDNSHHVTSRTDAMGQQTQYTYDSYGRLSEVQYYYYFPNDDPADQYQEWTPERVNYSYDSGQYGMGRLTGVAFGGTINDAFGDAYSYAYTYNQAGRVTSQQMGVQANVRGYNGYTWMTMTAAYQWDNEGRMTSLQYPTVVTYDNLNNPWTMPTAAYQYDANGRLSGMTMNGSIYGPQQLASATYGPAGQLLTLSDGAGTETRTYNSLLQLTNQSVPGYMNMTYNYSATQNNGRITSSVDGVTGESTTYSYDALNRLTGASNGLWSETYGYDGFGNLTSKAGTGGAPSMSVSYDANNHEGSASYDGNGNRVGSNSAIFISYSIGNRMRQEYWTTWPYPTSMYAYDPWGKRVMNETDPDPDNLSTGSDPTYNYNFYGITGQRLATVTCNPQQSYPLPTCAISGQNVYFGKKLLVSGGVTVVTDRLGSVRANTQGESMAYYAYGEERTSTVNGREKFGTYFRDGVGQDYADQRYYGSGTGRFWTSDPGGIGTATVASPASWNRYAYVQADPVNFADPRGAYLVDAGGGLLLDCGYGAESIYDGTCTGTDGGWGGCYGGGLGFLGMPDPGCPTGGGENQQPPAPPPPTCDSVLTQNLQTFLQANDVAALNWDPNLAADLLAEGASVNIDPRLFASILTLESGHGALFGGNNPFGLGPGNSYSSPSGAIQAEGTTLKKLVYTYKETTVADLYSGNGFVVNPKKPWIVSQYPAYCYGGANGSQTAACQNGGVVVAGFLSSQPGNASVGLAAGNPKNLSDPCQH